MTSFRRSMQINSIIIAVPVHRDISVVNLGLPCTVFYESVRDSTDSVKMTSIETPIRYPAPSTVTTYITYGLLINLGPAPAAIDAKNMASNIR